MAAGLLMQSVESHRMSHLADKSVACRYRIGACLSNTLNRPVRACCDSNLELRASSTRLVAAAIQSARTQYDDANLFTMDINSGLTTNSGSYELGRFGAALLGVGHALRGTVYASEGFRTRSYTYGARSITCGTDTSLRHCNTL